MSFREKSAWGMGLVTLLTGIYYAWLVAHAPTAPLLAPVIPYVLLVIVLAITVQVVLALASPKEAMERANERDRFVVDRSGRIAGMVLSVGILLAAGVYLGLPSGNMLFHHIIGAMIVAQLVDYGAQLVLYRRAW